MIKITEVGNNSDGKVLYLNPDCIESYDPKECELRLKDGRVLIINHNSSDVNVLTDGFHYNDANELAYLRQAMDGLISIIHEDDVPVVLQSGCDVPVETTEKALFVLDEVRKMVAAAKVDDKSDKKGKKG